MPYKEKEIERRYLTITDLAKSLKLQTSELRYWESWHGINIERRKNGDRKYNKSDRNKILIINHLVNRLGMTHEGIRREVSRHGWDERFLELDSILK